eukprot:CAMPEP_0119572620 /NCGR_PEP_ID=MMETSP1352-20130426/44706_1 /TAXON_ID=265584 /ORGANISM="Stauroneis constricta, Strain CCMP1120" /LENGTH=761 /DNA_ID=CAMNT_0007622305 /DNA_START=413 /DNA_END=2699 /DNA_ORIENTATION=-
MDELKRRGGRADDGRFGFNLIVGSVDLCSVAVAVVVPSINQIETKSTIISPSSSSVSVHPLCPHIDKAQHTNTDPPTAFRNGTQPHNINTAIQREKAATATNITTTMDTSNMDMDTKLKMMSLLRQQMEVQKLQRERDEQQQQLKALMELQRRQQKQQDQQQGMLSTNGSNGNNSNNNVVTPRQTSMMQPMSMSGSSSMPSSTSSINTLGRGGGSVGMHDSPSQIGNFPNCSSHNFMNSATNSSNGNGGGHPNNLLRMQQQQLMMMRGLNGGGGGASSFLNNGSDGGRSHHLNSATNTSSNNSMVMNDTMSQTSSTEMMTGNGIINASASANANNNTAIPPAPLSAVVSPDTPITSKSAMSSARYSPAPSNNATAAATNGFDSMPFPVKLHRLLQSLEQQYPQLSAIIGWNPEGRSFAIRNPNLFESVILPKFFQQNKIKSFQRCLTSYDFKCIQSGPLQGSFYHELFARSNPKLAELIPRKQTYQSKRKIDDPMQQQHQQQHQQQERQQAGESTDQLDSVSSAMHDDSLNGGNGLHNNSDALEQMTRTAALTILNNANSNNTSNNNMQTATQLIQILDSAMVSANTSNNHSSIQQLMALKSALEESISAKQKQQMMQQQQLTSKNNDASTPQVTMNASANTTTTPSTLPVPAAAATNTATVNNNNDNDDDSIESIEDLTPLMMMTSSMNGNNPVMDGSNNNDKNSNDDVPIDDDILLSDSSTPPLLQDNNMPPTDVDVFDDSDKKSDNDDGAAAAAIVEV